MMRLLTLPLVLLLLVAGALFWSAAGQETPADLTFINRGEIKTLDVGGISWAQDVRVAYGLWEGLYRLDPITLKPVPGVAQAIDIDPSHTVYTFHIRPSARWSNHAPLTSGDFVFAWRRMLEQQAEYSSLHYYIRGAQAYSDAYLKFISSPDPLATPPDYRQVGVEAIDDHTLRVTLADPIPFFPALCAYVPFFPQYEPCMRAFAQYEPVHHRVIGYDQKFTRPPNLVSNGPYRLAEWIFKRKLRMIASDYYWDRASVKSRIIDQAAYGDPLANFRAFASGQVDWLCEVDNDLAGEMLAQGGRPDLHIFPAFGTYYYTFNCQAKLPDGSPNPLVDPRVRQALTMAVDKDPIVRQVMRCGEPVAREYIPPGVFAGYQSPPGIPYDVAQARHLLAEAGYPGGQGFPTLSILFNKDPPHADVAQIIHRQWQTVLGINTNMEQVEVGVFADRLHRKDFAIARASWIGDYDDPSTFTDKWTSDNDNNEAGWSNATYDRLCQQARETADPAARLRLFSQAEGTFLSDAVILPIFHYTNRPMYRPNVSGIGSDPRNFQLLQNIEVHR